jgi:N-acetylmuramic acid 6-phosphate etherase
MLHDLVTEQQYVASSEIDRLKTEEMLAVINAADQEVAGAVAKTIPTIARAVDNITDRLQKGGTLYYIGAGTSGRLGVLDASEIPPTYNVPPNLVQGLIAGGDTAIRKSIEGAEDNSDQGKADLLERGFNSKDALLGIAASGRTPYVLGGVALATSLGALTIGLSCTPDSELARAVEISITPLPGPEVIAGSTRMRAGTATKLVLNMISTGVMIRLGYVYGNLMVNLQPTNSKLTDRAIRIVAQIAGVSYDEAQRLLIAAGSVRTAVLMHRLGLSREDAEAKLASAKGRLREALGENKTAPLSGDKA